MISVPETPLNLSCFCTFLSNPKSLFFSFILNVFYITSSHTFFIAPKLSQNNFKNQIIWEVLVGEVLVVGEVVGEFVAEVVGAVLVGAVQVGRC